MRVSWKTVSINLACGMSLKQLKAARDTWDKDCAIAIKENDRFRFAASLQTVKFLNDMIAEFTAAGQ